MSAMPIRRYRFRRSHSEMTSEERSYRRAASFLRDFHRTQSLDVILEEGADHHDDAPAAMPMLPKKRACMCLADLAAAVDEMDDSSSSSRRDDDDDEDEDDSAHDEAVCSVSVLDRHHHHRHQHDDDHHQQHRWGNFDDSTSSSKIGTASALSSRNRLLYSYSQQKELVRSRSS